MYLALNRMYVRDYNLEKKYDDFDNVRTIILNIFGDIQSVSYEIQEDQNHPDIDVIYDTLKTDLDSAKNDEDATIFINEYLERSYIFILLPNSEDTLKYTAKRL